MAKLRIGFSSDFTLDSSEVGIGTTNPTAKLQVVDTLKGDFNITGVSTLTVYGGFAAQKQNVTKDSSIGFSTTGIGTFTQPNERETGFLSLVGEYNTVSEDIIVDEGKIFEVSTTNITGITTLGTQEVYAPDPSVVSVGTLESVSIQSHFNVPNGGSNDRPDQPTEGMVRFNDDLNTLEFYNGVEWRQFTVTGASGRGVFGGAYTSPGGVKTTMDFINISSTGNAQSFGDLTVARCGPGACSSSIRGLTAGGYIASPTRSNVIDYITIASTGNAIDFGDRTAILSGVTACSSSTRGLFAGGYSPIQSNIIDYVTFSTIGNALDFGDMTFSGSYRAAVSSSTRAVFGGGFTPTYRSTIDFVTISSTGNAVYFGELTQAKNGPGNGTCSSSTRGIFAGGTIAAPTNNTVNTIEYVTISSTGNAIYFGDLTSNRTLLGACSTSIRATFGGGSPSAQFNTIDYITIASTGNAQDFGDLTLARGYLSACSDSHGGLGGF